MYHFPTLTVAYQIIDQRFQLETRFPNQRSLLLHLVSIGGRGLYPFLDSVGLKLHHHDFRLHSFAYEDLEALQITTSSSSSSSTICAWNSEVELVDIKYGAHIVRSP
jgi:hypothetical protein